MKTLLLFFLPSLVVGCGGAVGTAPANDGGPQGDAGACTSLGADVSVEDQTSIYPSYAIDGCRLAYVQRGTQRLVLRDLSSGSESFLTDPPATLDDVPRRPTLGDGTVAWEVGPSKSSAVLVATKSGTTKVTGGFDHFSEPRAFGGVVVVTAWVTSDPLGDSDVVLYDVASASTAVVASGPGQQRFADVNDKLVVFTDFSEDPDGRFDGNDTDLADIVVHDRATKVSTPRKATGKQAFPVLVGDDVLGYLHWGDVHPEPKFQAFGVRGARVGTPPSSDAIIADVTNATRFWLPSGRGATLDWIAPDANGKESLWRAPADGSSVKTSVLDGSFAGAPQASSALTIVAVRSGATTSLRAVAR